MVLEEAKIARAIIDTYSRELMDALRSDVIIAGGGPSGLVAATNLARAGFKTVVIERKLNIGGGVWGGGIMMNRIVFQEEVREIFEEFKINYQEYEKGYYTAHSVECVAAFTLGAIQAGVKIFNLLTVEDVVVKNDSLTGLVLNWTTVEMTGMHVDPVVMESRCVLDATGHDAVVVHKLVKGMGKVLHTPSGTLEGEQPMWADQGEKQVVSNTREAYPGLYVSGMAANATFGGRRMGPVFGGMLLSGQKAAREMLKSLQEG